VVMGVVEPLVEIAKASGCSDLDACREVVRAAAEEQRSVVHAILDSRLVEETAFLKGVGRSGYSMVERTDYQCGGTLTRKGAGEDRFTLSGCSFAAE